MVMVMIYTRQMYNILCKSCCYSLGSTYASTDNGDDQQY